MCDDLAKMSLEELREKLTSLVAARDSKPKYLAMIASASSENEALELYRKHRIQLGELRDLDLQIHALRSAIILRERQQEAEKKAKAEEPLSHLEMLIEAAEAASELHTIIDNRLYADYSNDGLSSKLARLEKLEAALRSKIHDLGEV